MKVACRLMQMCHCEQNCVYVVCVEVMQHSAGLRWFLQAKHVYKTKQTPQNQSLEFTANLFWLKIGVEACDSFRVWAFQGSNLTTRLLHALSALTCPVSNPDECMNEWLIILLQAKGPSGDKDWWAQKTNPSFPSAPIADSSATTSTSSAASSAAGPKQNPFLKGGSQEETKVRDAPVPGSKKQTGDQKNPRKEFEAGLMGAVSL